jgi:hypothetical protein
MQGRPIILTGDNKVRMFNKNLNTLKPYLRGIFRKKQDVLKPLLGQIDISISHPGEISFGSAFISKYLFFDNTQPLIVTWSGTMDVIIFKKLGIPGIKKFLNISTYDDNNDNIFSLKLIDTNNNKLLYSESIGYVLKNGRMLNLKETHDILCEKKHEVTYYHDPVTDIIYTKCIFNYLIKKIKPNKLFKIVNKNKMCKQRDNNNT